MTYKCPKCGVEGQDPENCAHCGINFEGYKRYQQHHGAKPQQPDVETTEWATRNSAQARAKLGQEPVPGPILSSSPFNSQIIPQTDTVVTATGVGSVQAFKNLQTVYVKQQEDTLRIVTGWQTLNHYAIVAENGEILGELAERDSGFIFRNFFKSRRPLQIDIYDAQGHHVAELWRPFFFFFSSLYVFSPDRQTLYGTVNHRWSWWLPKYDLLSGADLLFAKLRCPVFGTQDFSGMLVGDRDYVVYDAHERRTNSIIRRKLGDFLKRIFTDEDTYCIQMPDPWTAEQKLVIMAAAISIDFDSYEGGKSLMKDASVFSLFGLNSFGGNSNDN